MTLPRTALLLGCCMAACDAPAADDERLASERLAFASADAVLVDLELDAKLTADTMDPPKVRQLITTQLMFLVGQLNGARSVGRHDRAEVAVTTLGAVPAEPGRFAFRYHVRIPVAWGDGPPPRTFPIVLPARVGEKDQVAFTEKYAATCSDPEGAILGAADAGRMFLFFRPQREGCELAPADVVHATASMTTSSENTSGKYPEYHLVWDDDELDVVTVFGLEHDEGAADDPGLQAYEDFLQKAETYVGSLDVARTESPLVRTDANGHRSARIAAELGGGRRIRIDAMLVPPRLSETRSAFDDWYDARTPDADVVIYSGHANLGSNARLLARKGVFRARKYLVMTFNGCDTLAYLDPTLAQRRASLNPDDVAGTKYMDTLSNVLGGYFRSGDETSLQIIEAFASAITTTTPKTYRELFEGIDPTQIVVVTGEEDNEFRPGMLPPSPTSETAAPPPVARPEALPPPGRTDDERRGLGCGNSRCGAASAPAGRAPPGMLAAMAAAALLLSRRRARCRACPRRGRRRTRDARGARERA